MNAGVIGGIAGGVVGLAGGIIGTYFGIKNTAGPRERAFMIRVAVVTWVLIAAFLAGMLLIPQPYKWLLWIPYGFVLAAGIRWGNRRQQQIRAEESAGASGAAGEHGAARNSPS